MTIVKQFRTSMDFWSEVVVPDCTEYRADQENLRRALHCAISLFHMHDWVFHTHGSSVRSIFTFTDKIGAITKVSSPTHFANALEQQNDDFGRIRGIANAGKHLQLNDIRPVLNAPSNAANTAIQTTGYGQGGYGQGPYGGSPRVMLEGANGNDMEFLIIMEKVYQMWEALTKTHGW